MNKQINLTGNVEKVALNIKTDILFLMYFVLFLAKTEKNPNGIR